ncbi:MAG: hypothetical protein ABMA64_23550 [Myxococcota bacterium]
MSCNKILPPAGGEYQTYTTSVSYVWLTDYLLAPGMSIADVLVLLRSLTGSFNAKPAYQTAPVRAEGPDAPVVFAGGAYATTAGYTLYHEPLTLGDRLLVRFGLAFKNGSGTALGAGQAQVRVAVRQCAMVVATGGDTINPAQTSTADINYTPIGEFRPCVGLSKLMGAFIVSDNESNHLEYQLVVRTALDPRAPNSWQTAELAWTTPNTPNSERNTGFLTVPAGANLTSNLLFQVGIAYRKRSGATGNPRASISVVVAGTFT